jgi:5-methylcytosine-specific restriction endonuclease McrA
VALTKEEKRIRHNEAVKRWWDKDPERAKKSARERAIKAYRKNPEKGRAASAKFRKENPEKIKASVDKWFEENKEYRREYKKEYRRTHKKEITEYRKKNPARNKAYKQNRRAKQSGAGGSFTAKQWVDLCKKYDYRCLCCNRRRKLTADHVIPVSKGGSSNIRNIQPLCGPCNSHKHDGTTDFRRRRP